MLTSGYLPEYGRGGGGVLDVVTKSGSNEFHGLVFGNVSPWQASPALSARPDRHPDHRAPGLRARPGLRPRRPHRARQAVVLRRRRHRGPELRPHQRSERAQRRRHGPLLRRPDGLIDSRPLPGTRRHAIADQRMGQYLGKLTYSPGSNTRIELTHRGTPARSGGKGKYDIPNSTGRSGSACSTRTTPPTPSCASRTRTIRRCAGRSPRSASGSPSTRRWAGTNERTADQGGRRDRLRGGGYASMPRYAWNRTSRHALGRRVLQPPRPVAVREPVEDGDVRCPASGYVSGGIGASLTDRQYDRYQGREMSPSSAARWASTS